MRLTPPARHGRDHHARRPLIVLFTALGSLPAAASADDERPATWDMSLVELEAIGLGQYRGDPVPVPAAAPRFGAHLQPKAASQGHIFVNFDGANLSSGWDDSHTDTTQISECAGPFAAYGEGTKRDAVMQAVRNDWAAYNVVITDSRPASGDYTMNMTGPTNPFGGGVLGIAPLDCDDSQTHNNITYAFHSINDQFDASTTATTIGQEVAHSYGLEHVDEPGDIMNPYNAGGDPAFTDVCIGIVANGGIVCGSQHAANCGSSSQQNSHQELLNLFGPSAPDESSPVVTITAPDDGASFDVGASFDITVEASDEGSGIEELVLFYNGDPYQSDASEPYGWSVNDAPEGTYEFYVEAHDVAGNVSMSNTITVTVGDAAPADGSGGNGPGGGSGGGGDGGGGTGGGSASAGGGSGDAADEGGVFDEGGSGALPPGFGGDENAQGCACASDRERVGGLGLLGLGLLGLARRRRRD